jgi:hypothetical protein
LLRPWLFTGVPYYFLPPKEQARISYLVAQSRPWLTCVVPNEALRALDCFVLPCHSKASCKTGPEMRV